MKKLKFYFQGQILLRHCILKFVFTKQQIFFQLFTRSSHFPDTHTTVGTLIRIRENIREHGGKYVYRLAEEKEFSAKEILRDKKYVDYFFFYRNAFMRLMKRCANFARFPTKDFS